MSQWRGAVARQAWRCRGCCCELGIQDGAHLRLTGGVLLAVGAEWGELRVRCQGCGQGAVWYPARMPQGARAKIG